MIALTVVNSPGPSATRLLVSTRRLDPPRLPRIRLRIATENQQVIEDYLIHSNRTSLSNCTKS
jgi:hypothetical protein